MPRQDLLQQSENNMKTPDPNDPTIEGLEHLNPEEVEKSAIMKAIESLKQDMNNSLKELDEKYNKKFEEMSIEMDEKYNKKFEEISKSVNDTLRNQEKNNQTSKGNSPRIENWNGGNEENTNR